MNAHVLSRQAVRGAMLVLLSVLLAFAARSQVITVVPATPYYYGPVSLTVNIDFNGDGITDFILTCDDGGAFLAPQGSNSLIVVPQPPPDEGSLLAPLYMGDVVSYSPSSLDPLYQWFDTQTDPIGATAIGSQRDIGGIGYFFYTTAYAGFDLYFDGAHHYGWMRVANPIGVVAGKIDAWAYETRPNTPIRITEAGPQAAMTIPTLIPPNQIRLTWQTQNGKTYQVQYQETLQSQLHVWANLDFSVVATATNASVQVPILGTSRFYRVVQIQ